MMECVSVPTSMHTVTRARDNGGSDSIVTTYSHAESTPLPPAWNHSSVAVVSLTDGVWCMTSPSEQYGRQTPSAKVSSTHGVGEVVGTALTADNTLNNLHTHTISLTVCRGMAEARSTREREGMGETMAMVEM